MYFSQTQSHTHSQSPLPPSREVEISTEALTGSQWVGGEEGEMRGFETMKYL